MAIDKDQIGKSRSDRFQYMAGYRWQPLKARNILDCGMAAVDYRCRTWMEADVIQKIFCSLSNILLHQFVDIPTSRAEQSKYISCSVISPMRDYPTPFHQMAEDLRSDSLQLLMGGFSRESTELPNYLHLASPIQ